MRVGQSQVVTDQRPGGLTRAEDQLVEKLNDEQGEDKRGGAAADTSEKSRAHGNLLVLIGRDMRKSIQVRDNPRKFLPVFSYLEAPGFWVAMNPVCAKRRSDILLMPYMLTRVALHGEQSTA